VRIIAGTHRGRRLEAPAGRDVRPMTDRTREALFNILAHGGWGPDGGNPVIDAVVLDAFCGTGALALEALSRGAAEAWLLDVSNGSLAAARRNVDTMGEAGRTHLMRADSTRPPPGRTQATLVFIAPPYGRALAPPAISALAEQGWMAPDAIVVVELAVSDPFGLPEGFDRLDDRRYGATRLVFLRGFQGKEHETGSAT